MQAAEDGAEIEMTDIGDDNWVPAPNPSWNWLSCDYRVDKYKPREFWRNYYYHLSKAGADKAASLNTGRTECVHFREVLEDG